MSASARRLYFDNAATSHPKPPAVLAAVIDYHERIHASAGRGAYREAIAAQRVLTRCRQAVQQLFNCNPGDQVIFTLNGTDALNLALKSVVRPADHVITTVMDHNSVLRPLSALAAAAGVNWTAIPADPQTTLVDPTDIVQAITPQTRLVAVSHASNVTGALQPIETIADICQQHGVLFLVDAAQSAGHVPINLRETPIDMLACPGHKGLLGPLGTGVLVLRKDVEKQMRTVREGGTGSASERPVQPDELPDRFEAGSHNAPGIAGLLAGLEWLLEQGVHTLHTQEQARCQRLMKRLDATPGLAWFGPRDVRQRVGVFSLRMAHLAPEEVSALLDAEYGILSRSGLHCAPLAHRTIGTLERGGTTRLSLGPFTTDADIDAVAAALQEIARAVRPAPDAAKSAGRALLP